VARKTGEGAAGQGVELGLDLGDAQLPPRTWKHVQVIGCG
jgi:hypothetical protein